MATDKKKKEVKVRDLKPSKDAKGGGGRTLDTGRGLHGHTTHGPKTHGPGTALRLLQTHKPPSGPIPPGGLTYR